MTQAHCLGFSKLFKVRATLQTIFCFPRGLFVVIFVFLSSTISVKKQLKKNCVVAFLSCLRIRVQLISVEEHNKFVQQVICVFCPILAYEKINMAVMLTILQILWFSWTVILVWASLTDKYWLSHPSVVMWQCCCWLDNGGICSFTCLGLGSLLFLVNRGNGSMCL